MQKTIKTSFALMFAMSVALIAILAYQSVTSSVALAQENEVGEQVGQPEEAADYTYSAQTGDSYTEIARKAVQTYGIDKGVNLTPAGIIFAETNLTQESGVGEIEVGQEITLDGNTVKKWVDAAGKLSEAEQKAWDVYVPFVNFNTNGVGQSN